MRAMPSRRIPIGGGDVQQSSLPDTGNCQSHEGGVAPEAIDVHEIEELLAEVVLREHPVGVEVGDDPGAVALGRDPGVAGEVGEDEGAAALGGVVGPDEGGTGLGEVAEGADAAAAHGVEDTEAAAGRERAPMEGGREDAEVAADGALTAEEGVARLELDAALSFQGVGEGRQPTGHDWCSSRPGGEGKRGTKGAGGDGRHGGRGDTRLQWTDGGGDG